MKIEMNVSGTSKSVKMAANVIKPKPIAEEMGGIEINAGADGVVMLKASNGDYELIRRVEANVKEPGKVLLDGKRLAAIFGSVSGETMVIETSEGKPNATLKCGGSRFTVAILPGELPEKQEVDKAEAVTMEIGCVELLDGLSHVRYAMAKEGPRTGLMGVLAQIGNGNVTLVALDGFKMGLVRKACMETNGERDVTIPAEAVNQIAAMCADAGENETVYVEVDEKAIRVTTENAELISSLIAEKFVDYRAVIPRDAATSARFDASMFIAAMKRASIAAPNNLFRLAVRDGEMEISSNDLTKTIAFSEAIPCQKMGGDIETAYNLTYMLETMNAVGTSEAQLDLTGALSPGVVKPVDGGKELHVLLPVRVVGST